MVLDLPILSVAGRLERVRVQIDAHEADALIVTDLDNIRWCTGFSGSYGALVITPDRCVLITDSRYREQAPAEIAAAGAVVDLEVTSGLVAAATGLLTGVARVALEADHVSWAEHRRWADSLDAELIATTALVLELRSVKDEAELARMQSAAAIVDDALAEHRLMLQAGTREREVAAALDDGMRRRGATGPAYETIVASGPNAALPHARAGDRCLAEGDLVVVDAGAMVDGYRSDMTRTFTVGVADDRARQIYDIVSRAQAAGVAAVRPGIEVGEIDRVCRSLISDEGFGEMFEHGTGHGVGLAIHELPAVRGDNAAILQPGHVITVEPGIYISGYGGVRVEDMVVVTDDGCRPLTKYPKEPPCPPSPPTT